MDKIVIKGLQVNSLIGVYDWEREKKQQLLIDVEIFADLSTAAASDDLTDTFDYAAMALAIAEVCEASNFELLEALAGHIIKHLFTYTKVQRVVLSITKPGILKNAQSVSVVLDRIAN